VGGAYKFPGIHFIEEALVPGCLLGGCLVRVELRIGADLEGIPPSYSSGYDAMSCVMDAAVLGAALDAAFVVVFFHN
jgi:hypothetical protein